MSWVRAPDQVKIDSSFFFVPNIKQPVELSLKLKGIESYVSVRLRGDYYYI